MDFFMDLMLDWVSCALGLIDSKKTMCSNNVT